MANETENKSLGYDHVQEAKRAVLKHFGLGYAPRIGIVLGSGLGQLEDSVSNKRSLGYSQITHMPSPSVKGHGGQLIVGQLGGQDVACLSGRVHLYEGHSTDRVVFGVRLLSALGAQILIVTNASGGMGDDTGPGRFMLITDHINFTGKNPLTGPNDARFGPRFPDMSHTYDPELGDVARASAKELKIPLLEGVYVGVLGPSYETPAEINMFRNWGASAVGMSTVHEVIAARHAKMRVLGVSCITNFAAGQSPFELKHDDVAQAASNSSEHFCRLIATICARIA